MGAHYKIKTFWKGQYLETVEQNILILGNEIRAIGYITGTGKNGDILEVHYEITLSSDWDFQNASIFKNNTDTILISKSGITQEGEWHFAWALEGRAIQDVWIVPRRGNRNMIEDGNRYGTSLRVFNPEKQLWELTWINPVTGAFDRIEGKEIDGELVHEGTDNDGNLQRWSFKEIEQNSFHWTGELSTDGGNTWRLEAEFYLTREKL